MIRLYQGILLINKKEQTTVQATTCMQSQGNYAERGKKRSISNGHILCDSIHKITKSQSWRAHEWQHGGAWGEVWVCTLNMAMSYPELHPCQSCAHTRHACVLDEPEQALWIVSTPTSWSGPCTTDTQDDRWVHGTSQDVSL